MKKGRQKLINVAAVNRALSHHQKGELLQAEAIYREVLRMEPNNTDALHYLGIIAHQNGKNEAALELIEKAIAVNRAVPVYHINAGIIYYALSRLDEAAACYRRALSLKPDYCEALASLGSVLQEQGKMDEAIACYRRALSINPDFDLALNNLGNALQEQGKLDEAIIRFERALSLNPDFYLAHNNLGNVLDKQGKPDEAIICFQRALSINPGFYLAHNNWGNVLREQGKPDEAIICFQRALSINPDFYLALYNMGVVLQEHGRLEEAITFYRRALSLKPDSYEAHFNLAATYLLKGDLKEGWEEYKYRFKRKDFARHCNLNYLNFSQPYWDGSEIKGKTILLYSEQGFGDTIQFIRYVPMVLEKCDRITVVCQEELVPLMRRVKGIHQVAGRVEQLPGFDFHCPLLNLPSVFNTTLQTVPAAIPYLTNDPQKVLKWRERLQSDSAGLKIGLCWSGEPTHKNDRNRSIPLDMFSMPGEAENITFYSLQKGKAAEQAKNTPEGMCLVDHTKELNDFSDTGALIENLDLIISVDTAVAHLAGALGKPVWTLLPFMPDWRWMLDRADTPWYPAMRLFRQSSIGDWSGVITSIKDALAQAGALNGPGSTAVVK